MQFFDKNETKYYIRLKLRLANKSTLTFLSLQLYLRLIQITSLFFELVSPSVECNKYRKWLKTLLVSSSVIIKNTGIISRTNVKIENIVNERQRECHVAPIFRT